MDPHDPLIDRLNALAHHPVDPAVAAEHLDAMAAVQPSGRVRHATQLKVAAGFLAGFLVGGTGLAAAGALPASAQNVAHGALATVGVNVPRHHGPVRYNGPECGVDPQTGQPWRNHGAYVRAHPNDPNAGSSQCGKPVHAPKAQGNGSSDGGPDGGNVPPGQAKGGHGHGRGHGPGGAAAGDTPDSGEAATTTTAAPAPAVTAPAPTTTTAPPVTTTAAPTTTSTTAPAPAMTPNPTTTSSSTSTTTH